MSASGENVYPGKILEWVVTTALSMLVLSFMITVSVSIFCVAFPHGLDGIEQIKPDNVDVRPNYLRNFLEILFFIGNIVFFITAVIALILAKRHASHAGMLSETIATATKANLHRRLFARLRSNEIREGIAICNEISSDYSAGEALGRMTLAEYTIQQIKIWRTDDEPKFKRILTFLDDLEEIGLSVRRDYYLMDDVYDMFEGPLRQIDEIFFGYMTDVCNEARLEKGTSGILPCEHALWLLAKRRGSYKRSRPLAP
jgi:hypothetical protein